MLWLYRHSQRERLADALLALRVAHAAGAPAAYAEGGKVLANFEGELSDSLEELSDA